MAAVLTPTRSAKTAACLPYGELAIALCASDLPDRPLADGELFFLAGQGFERLGGSRQVRELHRAWVRLNEDFLCGRISSGLYDKALKVLWPDPGRFDLCLAYDCRLRARGDH
jgi:hypothetical protein